MKKERILGQLSSDVYKRQILGEFPMPILKERSEIREWDGKENVPGQHMWTLFSHICKRIGQPCARDRWCAEPGDWYLSLCGKRTWYIFIKTKKISPNNPNGESRQVFTIPGLVAGEMIETLMYVDAFIFQYNQNSTGEKE